MSALCEHLVHTMKHMFCVKWTRLIVYVPIPTSQHFLPPVSNLKRRYYSNMYRTRLRSDFLPGSDRSTSRFEYQKKTRGRYCSRKYHKLRCNHFYKTDHNFNIIMLSLPIQVVWTQCNIKAQVYKFSTDRSPQNSRLIRSDMKQVPC